MITDNRNREEVSKCADCCGTGVLRKEAEWFIFERNDTSMVWIIQLAPNFGKTVSVKAVLVLTLELKFA